MTEKPFKPVYWLWIPLCWMAAQLIAEVLIPYDTLAVLHDENGPHELMQVGLLALGLVVALRTLYSMERKANYWLTALIALAAFCCLYVGAEELSWGQTILKWNTPEYWAEINNQKETNIHNTSKWFNQKPRFLLEIGILFGGILLPLAKRFKPSWVPKRFEIIYPPTELWVIAAIAAVVKLIDKGGREVFGIDFFTRPSEVGEVYLFYFVALYLITMKNRLAGAKPHP
jgi:hypothetical protein